MKLLEGVSTYRNRLQHSQFRPQGSVSDDAKAWWLYGCQAVLQQQTRVWLVDPSPVTSMSYVKECVDIGESKIGRSGTLFTFVFIVFGELNFLTSF